MTEDEMVGWHHQFKGHEFEYLLQEAFSETLLPSWALHTVGVSHWVKTAGGADNRPAALRLSISPRS